MLFSKPRSAQPFSVTKMTPELSQFLHNHNFRNLDFIEEAFDNLVFINGSFKYLITCLVWKFIDFSEEAAWKNFCYVTVAVCCFLRQLKAIKA